MTAVDPLIADLRDRRIAAGLSQTALAKAVGCSVSLLSEYESGRRPNPTLATLRKIGQALGVQPGWLPLAYETAPAAHLRTAGNGAHPEGGIELPSVAPASDPVPVVFGDRADVAHVATEDPTGRALRCSCGSWSMLYRNSFGLDAHDAHDAHAKCMAVARTLDVAERTADQNRNSALLAPQRVERGGSPSPPR